MTMTLREELEKGGYIKLSEDEKRVTYVAQQKGYRLDPEELVRARFYLELIFKYGYKPERFDLEFSVPARTPEVKADIVIYEDDAKKKPYIVVECKRPEVSQAEIRQAIEQAFGNANTLRAKYAIVVAGDIRRAFDVAGFDPAEREKNIIADIPVNYGKVVEFKFKKDDPQRDLRTILEKELETRFKQCHDILWEGGRRNPAEAFDEMSKLIFCKVHDERFLTEPEGYYLFQIKTHESAREVAKRIREIYEHARQLEPEIFLEDIKVDDPIIYGVVEVLQGVSLTRTDLDAKDKAFEHFLGAVFRGRWGNTLLHEPSWSSW